MADNGGRWGSSSSSTVWRQYGGILLTLLANFLFSLVSLLVKLLMKHHVTAEESSFWRYVGVTIPALPLIVYYECTGHKKMEEGSHHHSDDNDGPEIKKKSSVFSTIWPLNEPEKIKIAVGLLSRGIFGASSVLFRFFSLEYLTIGDTSVISYSSPVFVSILAHVLLGEKTGFIAIVTAIVALIGVAIVTRPPILTGAESFDYNILTGTALATGSLICSTLLTIITRRIRSVHFSLMLLVFGSIGLTQSFILSQILNGFSLPVGTSATLMVVGIAVISFLAQTASIMALKMETAGIFSLVRTSAVVFGFILQFIFLGVVPDVYSALGGSLVFACVLFTAYRKYLASLPPQNNLQRRILSFLI